MSLVTVNLMEITHLSLQLAQWCLLECEVGPWKVMFGSLVLGISVGRQVLFLQREALLYQINCSCARQALSQGQG